MFTLNGDGICLATPAGDASHHAEMIPPGYLDIVRRGLQIVENDIVGVAGCDAIFQALPRGVSLSALVGAGVNIHYDPSNREGNWGWTQPGRFPTDVVLTRFCIRMGHWSIAGTLVHEMAHLAGADSNSHAAENTLQFCKLKSTRGPYNPGILG